MSDCAIGPDGKLLDADSSEPINQATTPSITTASSSTAIHLFFHGDLAPTVVVTGAHHSRCVTCPSNRINNPNNAEALSSATMHKCKASGGMTAGRCINCKVAIKNEGSTNDGEIDDQEPDIAEHPATTSDDQAGNTKPDDLAYASTKAMGDADCEVRLFLSL